MASDYCVFIGDEMAINELTQMHSSIQSFDYARGLKLVPYTSALHASLCQEYGENPPGGYLKGSNSLCVALSTLIKTASLKGKMAYILEEHFGGWRVCESILWKNGEIIFGPSSNYEAQTMVLKKLSVDEQHLHEFRKYEYPDEWLQDSYSSGR